MGNNQSDYKKSKNQKYQNQQQQFIYQSQTKYDQNQNNYKNNDQDTELKEGLLYLNDKDFQKTQKLLIDYLKKAYPEIQPQDRQEFCNNHPWLIQDLIDDEDMEGDQIRYEGQQVNQQENIIFNDKNKQIVKEEIIQFIEGKLERIRQIQREFLHNPNEKSQNNFTPKVDDSNILTPQQQQEQQKVGKLPLEYRFIEKVDEIVDKIRKQTNNQNVEKSSNQLSNAQSLEIHLGFLTSTIDNIIQNPNSNEFRSIKINKFQLKFWNDIKIALRMLGFKEIESEKSDDFCELILNQEKIEYLYKFVNYLKQSYKEEIEKFSFKQVKIEKIESQKIKSQNQDIDNLIKNPQKQPQNSLFKDLQDDHLTEEQLSSMTENQKRVYYQKQAQQARMQQNLNQDQIQYYQNQNQEFQKFGYKNPVQYKQYSNGEINNNNNYFGQTNRTQVQKQIITMDKLEAERIKDDQKALELLAWELSNKFREQNGLTSCLWSDNISQISYFHSKNMGEGKVQFGHDGFNDRSKEIAKTCRIQRACENVAYSTRYSNLAQEIVNGWIKSPGHCKNLLSNSNYMGIGVYRSSSGKWYFTQIFVLI